MKENCDLKPSISIDPRKHRIRIHKVTLHLLGNPSYIQLLVNPNEKMIAIKTCGSRAKLSHRVDLENIVGNSFELYSTNLIDKLCAIDDKWDGTLSFRLYGEIVKSEGIAKFYMRDAVLLNGAPEVRDEQ